MTNEEVCAAQNNIGLNQRTEVKNDHYEVYGPNCVGSANIEKIAGALSALQGSMSHAAENSKNPHFKSSYADLSACWQAVRPHLAANGLSVTQSLSSEGKTAVVTTVVMHASGQWLSSTLKLEAKGSSAQDLGGAFTYARRYALCGALGITSDEDDDGNVATRGHMEREDIPYQKSAASPAQPVRHAPGTYSGSDSDWQKLVKHLTYKKVAVDMHERIAEKMLGKPVDALDGVIADVIKNA